MSKKDRMIALLSAAATAENAEEDAAVISEFQFLFEPAETREVMGGAFMNILGYDPITYYDRKDMGNIIETIADNVNAETGKYIRKHKKDILTGAMSILEMTRESTLYNAVVRSIREYSGNDISDDGWEEIQQWVADKFDREYRPNPDFDDTKKSDEDEDPSQPSVIDASDFDDDDEDSDGDGPMDIDVDDVDDDEDHIDTSKLGFIDDDEDDQLIDELMQSGEEDEDDDD